MKRVISILLLVSLFLPSLGTFLWFHQHQRIIRKETKELLLAEVNESELELLTFTQHEVDHVILWKHKGEFEYKGTMYDIVKRKMENGSYSFWCWKDDKETLLSQKLEELLADLFGNNAQERQQQQHLLQFFNTVFQSEIDTWEPIATYFQEEKTAFTYSNHYQSRTIVPKAPPPLFN